MKEELIQPKVVVTPEMAETYTSVQWEKLTKLLYDTDKMMEKEEFRRVIFESEFTESLSQDQRDTFIKANRIDWFFDKIFFISKLISNPNWHKYKCKRAFIINNKSKCKKIQNQNNGHLKNSNVVHKCIGKISE